MPPGGPKPTPRARTARARKGLRSRGLSDRRSGIHLLDPGTVRSDGVRFIGATLWTDLVLEGTADENGAHMRVSREVSDFLGAIQHQGRDLTTGESVARHRADRAFIECEVEEAERVGDRAVVITHHVPSPRSIRPWFEGGPFNCAFASDLGHVHDPVDERLGRTRLLANPAGYRHENKRGFDPGPCVGLDEAVACGEEPRHAERSPLAAGTGSGRRSLQTQIRFPSGARQSILLSVGVRRLRAESIAVRRVRDTKVGRHKIVPWPNSRARRFQPTQVPSGTSTIGARTPAISLPSASTAGTRTA